MQHVEIVLDHDRHFVGMPGRGVIELGAVEIRPRRQDTHAAEHLRALQGKLVVGMAIGNET